MAELRPGDLTLGAGSGLTREVQTQIRSVQTPARRVLRRVPV